MHFEAGFDADRLTRGPQYDGATIVTAPSGGVGETFQTGPDTAEVAELPARLEVQALRLGQLAILQDAVAEAVAALLGA